MNINLKLVIGLGKTGISCIRYLTKKDCNLAVADTRINPPGLQELKKEFPSIPVHTGELKKDLLLSAQEIIVSPGVPISDPSISHCIQQGINVIGDIELFIQSADKPIIAITGSNGKSTVTSLLGEMLKSTGKKVGVGGNIGIPVLELLEQKHDLYVIELSSFQLETTPSLKAEVATVLNVSADHMDRYRNFEEYLKIKQRIYLNSNIAIINRDDPLSHAKAKLPTTIISFGTDRPTSGNLGLNNGYLVYGEQQLIPIENLKLKGAHNIRNALAALALGTALKISFSSMIKTLQNFAGLPHRCQMVATVNNVEWYNDSKATNIDAAKSAIEELGINIDGKIILIAGGLTKGADFSLLKDSILRYVKTTILIGQDKEQIAAKLGTEVNSVLAESMKDAVKICAEKAKPGDIVLLAPACASFDMFDNFEHRGEEFIYEINNLNNNIK